MIKQNTLGTVKGQKCAVMQQTNFIKFYQKCAVTQQTKPQSPLSRVVPKPGAKMAFVPM